MTTLANVTLPPDVILDPFLAGFVVPFALANPMYSFTNTKSLHMGRRDQTVDKINGEYEIPPDGKKFTWELYVHCNNQKVGEIHVERDWRKGVTLYVVQSDRIEKLRGSRNVTSTSKLNIAQRNAKKYWKPKDFKELFDSNNAKTMSEFKGSLSSLKYPIARTSAIGSKLIKLQIYMFNMLTNREIKPSTKQEIEDLFTSPTYEKQMGDYELAREMERLDDARKIITLMKHEDGFLFMEEGTVLCKPYEDLPEDWQNKLAVLQLVGDEEVVRDVGFRYTNESFAIIK
jgi:hypothetical protein